METPGSLTPEQRKDVENMTQAFQQFQQNNPLSQTATPATPTKKLLPKDPKIQSFQDEIKKLDPTAFPKFGADGRRGKEVNDAITKYPDIAAKYGLVGGSSQKVAPAATATITPKTIADYDAAMKTATDKLTQLYKVDPNSAETKAANAELMKLAQGKSALMKNPVAPAQPTGGAAAYTETPEYKKLLANLQTTFKSGAESPAYKQAMADLQAYINAQTPVAESVGFASDELNRIVSLVHHR